MVDLKALCAECGVEFYDVETTSVNGRAIYRVYITKKGGVTLEDCTKLSRLLSPIYDVEPPIGGDWTLEVSSPGLERKLEKSEHYANSIGEVVCITTLEKEKIIGQLVGFSGDEVEISQDDKNLKISITQIKKARTHFQW